MMVNSLRAVMTTIIVWSMNSHMLAAQMGLRTTSIGSTEVIRCFPDKKGVDVAWIHEGEIVSINGLIYTINLDHRARYSMIGDHQNGHYNLQIKNIKAEDTGKWDCMFGPPGNVETIKRTVMIVIPPDDGYPSCVLSSPTVIRTGDPYELVCDSSGGFPAPTLVWLRDGVELLQTDTDDSLVLERIADQTDNNAQYTCEVRSLAWPTAARTCTQNVMVIPTDKPPAPLTTSLTTSERIITTEKHTTQQPSEKRTMQHHSEKHTTQNPKNPTTVINKFTNALNPDATQHDGRSTDPNSDHISERPHVTNAQENTNQTENLNPEATQSPPMFDALTIFGLLCGFFLVILILMAVSWTKGRKKTFTGTPETEKMRGSTESIVESENKYYSRPYSTTTLNSTATTETIYHVPRVPSVPSLYCVSLIDRHSGEIVSTNVEMFDDQDKIYQHDESLSHSTDIGRPIYAKVKKNKY
ncbi:uncharacterized protein [Antedon mediterranea]|uniref:uncharacterized protein n=1 Tax=Antedon mediterranea TaxID=105859 RepID=UPI003AF76B79